MAFANVFVVKAIRPQLLMAAGLACALGYGLVARAVSARKTVVEDHKTRRKLQQHRTPEGDLVAEALGPLGKEWFYIPLAATLSAYLWQHNRGLRALTPVLASVGVEGVSRILDRLPPHRQPPPGQPKRHKPSFPSGHAMETTAVAMTTAYVLARENIADARPAFAAAAVLSVVSPLGRLYRDRHWLTDTVGGACAGLGIAAASAALYDAAGRRRFER